MKRMPSWATDRRACDRRHLGAGRHRVSREGFEEILDLITLSDPPAGVPATVLAELGMVLSARLNMDPRSLISRLVEP
jgi:hypothetical protein